MCAGNCAAQFAAEMIPKATRGNWMRLQTSCEVRGKTKLLMKVLVVAAPPARGMCRSAMGLQLGGLMQVFLEW